MERVLLSDEKISHLSHLILEKLTFIGQSEIVQPNGQILHRASQDRETLYLTEINPLDAREKKINPYNNLINDRDPKSYEI